MSKKIMLLVLVAVLSVSVAACSAVQDTANSDAQAAAPADAPRTITVVGQGKVHLTPDVATISVGSEARANSVAEAKAQVDAEMEAIMAALKEAGIADKDIQTSHYGIHFEREPISPMRDAPAIEIEGQYVVSTMLEVTIRSVERAGEVLDAVVQAGANQVYGVAFTVSDESDWQSQARAEAMADARSRAQELADLAGVELSEVLSVSEVVGGMPVSVMMAAERGMGGGGFAPGELELGTQIQVVFAAK